MNYKHIDLIYKQSSFNPGTVCGDRIEVFRTPEATFVMLADGCGHGIKANIYAAFIISRLKELLYSGENFRQSMQSVVKNIEESKGKNLPYAAVTAIKILNNGEVTVLRYEMPPSYFITKSGVQVLKGRTVTAGKAVINEALGFIEPSEYILTACDGITDAGIGLSLRYGWGTEKIREYIASMLRTGIDMTLIAERVHDRARALWENVKGDDCTAMLCCCREGKKVTLLTGPPVNSSDDHAVVEKFMQSEGKKIVCGSTTANIVAKHLKTKVLPDSEHTSMITPPGYQIDGIDLATEGAITLNQTCNLIGVNLDGYEEDSPATELCKILQEADYITFIIGQAHNVGHDHLGFLQRGILPRIAISEKLAKKLQKIGKLVVTEYA